MTNNLKLNLLLLLGLSGMQIVFGGTKRQFTNTGADNDPGAMKAVTMFTIPPVPELPKLHSRPISNNMNGKHPQLYLNQQQQLQQLGNPEPPAPTGNQQAQEQYIYNEVSSSVPAIIPESTKVNTSAVESKHSNATTTDLNKAIPSTQETVGKEPSKEVHIAVVNASKPEKISTEFNKIDMPPQVMHILNALGTGGSLAQASKPEKDGVGHSTANAIGYATGDNATVTAFVSNQMAVQPQTVTITDTASASASSSSNGTAFSQATLSSNGWTHSFNGWPAPGGMGWKYDPVNFNKI